jgi:uncharacterized membrane protein
VDLIMLVIVLCVIGAVVWALTTLVPMPPQWARAIQVIAFVVMLLYVLTRVFRLPNVLGG